MSLTDLERRFAEHYVAGGGVGAQAARDAGYSDGANHAAVHASRLLRRDDVLAEIRRLAQCRISAAVAVAAAELEDIARDRKSLKRSTQLKAIESILNRGGMLVERLSTLQVNVTHRLDTMREGDKWRRDLLPMLSDMGLAMVDRARFDAWCDWLNGPAQPALIDATPIEDEPIQW